MNDLRCQIPGCNKKGALLDHDNVLKCQQHMAEAAFKQMPPKIVKIKRNSPCPCESGKKYKNCCGLNDKQRQWFQQRIGKAIYYKNKPECPVPDCDECKQAEKGIKIQNLTHARKLYEYSLENSVEFTTEKP